MSEKYQMASWMYLLMNAILMKPPKFLAVFSKREKTRRFSLIHPISRSMTFRSRYASRSNSTSRLSRSWFFRRRDDRLNAKLEEVLIDPVGAIAHVACQRDGPCDRPAIVVGCSRIRPDQQVVEHRGFMRLSAGQMKVERMSLPVTQKMNLRRIPAARTSQRVIGRFVGIAVFSPRPKHIEPPGQWFRPHTTARRQRRWPAADDEGFHRMFHPHSICQTDPKPWPTCQILPADRATVNRYAISTGFHQPHSVDRQEAAPSSTVPEKCRRSDSIVHQSIDHEPLSAFRGKRVIRSKSRTCPRCHIDHFSDKA